MNGHGPGSVGSLPAKGRHSPRSAPQAGSTRDREGGGETREEKGMGGGRADIG